jgi:hypothetical protein
MTRLLEKEVREGSVVVERDVRIPTRDSRASEPRPPGNAGSRSATCARRASACWSAPAASA